MNRRKQFSVGKFLKWAVIVTLVVAAIEIPIIYFFARPTKPATANVEETIQAPPPEQENTIVTAPPAVEKQVQVQPKQSTSKPKDTTAPPLVIAPIKPAQADTKKAVVPRITPPIADPIAKVEWTETLRQQVLNQLNAHKEALGGNTRCVKIRQTSSSNVNNGFKIAEYLKQNGYFISGRETVSGKVKGALVSNNGGCLVVTIGTF